MNGNVWEWCWDSRSYRSRYNCGGSCYNNADYCEVGDRDYSSAGNRYYGLGFRIVRNMDE